MSLNANDITRSMDSLQAKTAAGVRIWNTLAHQLQYEEAIDDIQSNCLTVLSLSLCHSLRAFSITTMGMLLFSSATVENVAVT